MKKVNLLPMIAAISLSALLITGCAKEQGCMDDNATNFSETAEEDDGSCTFEGEIVFWYGETTSDFLVNDLATSLTYYVDGEIVGSSSANVFWTGAPECGANGTVTITKDLGSDKSKSVTFRVIDDWDWEYWSGNITVDANTCLQFELSSTKSSGK